MRVRELLAWSARNSLDNGRHTTGRIPPLRECAYELQSHVSHRGARDTQQTQCATREKSTPHGTLTTGILEGKSSRDERYPEEYIPRE